jgi:hypothetical protein
MEVFMDMNAAIFMDMDMILSIEVISGGILTVAGRKTTGFERNLRI